MHSIWWTDRLSLDNSFTWCVKGCIHPSLVLLSKSFLDVYSNSFFLHHASLKYYRQREPHHSEKGTTSRTRLAVAAERLPTTSKRRHALHADTQLRKWETLTGDRRQRAGELLVLDVWDTWRLWPAGSRMDSGREHKPRKWLLARSKLLYSC